MELKYTLKLYILAQGAESAPPLGTILGNLGVNSINFCKDFNQFTSFLPPYLTVSVTIFIYSNKSYKFIIGELPLGPIINLLLFERLLNIQGDEVSQKCILLKHVVQLALFKFPGFSLKRSLPMILGTLKSFNLVII